MKKLAVLLFSAGIACTSTALAKDLSADQADNKWYEKSFSEILNSEIITATRNDSTVDNAPGVVSVYSSDTLQKMGVRSIKELLERTTGFFVNRQFTGATVGSRGFIADTDQFLMLIDGHNVNSIVDKGMGEQFLFPNLEHVARVEIIRGPGSTLWGSDAALGIIHIITKTGKDIDGTKVTVNRSNEDNQQHVNIQGGFSLTDNIHGMASFTKAQSDGFTIENQFGKTESWGKWDRIEDSYEFYAKAKVNNFTLKARAYDTKTSRPYSIFQLESEPGFTRRSHYYLDLSHVREVNQNFTIESKFWGDLLKRTQILVSPQYASNAVTAQESEASQESSVGAEMIARFQFTTQHRLMLGYKWVETELDPYTHRAIYPVTATISSNAGSISQLVVPPKSDINQAVFIEHDWAIIPNTLQLLAGLRFDENNLREKEMIILPRFSLNWQVNSNLQIKNSYNTGYIRPSVGIGFLGQAQFNPQVSAFPITGAGESQEVSSFDQQYVMSFDRIKASLNLYYNRIKNPYQVIFEDDMLASRTVFYTNVNDVETYGAEIELAYLVHSNINVYANVSKVFSAKTKDLQGHSKGYDFDLNQENSFWGGPSFGQGAYNPDGTMQGFPHLIINTGVNWEIIDGLSSNLHLRFSDEMEVRDVSNNHANFKTDVVKLDSQLFVDLNIRYENIAGTDIDASIYAKNLLDNDDAENYMILYSNTWQEQGRRVGASLAYQF